MARRRRNGRPGAKAKLRKGEKVVLLSHYVRVTFFRGTSLRPLPPGASKHKDVRYFDIREGDELDEAQMANWVKQAAAL